jgi:hydrogenase nickel incorporation protein HypA/HybF
MHEASIVLSILSIAEGHCRKAGYGRVESIGVRIGNASGVMADALLSAFDIVKLGTISEGAELIIEGIPLGGECRSCGGEFTTDEPFILQCPECGSADFDMVSGRELDITEIEVA